MRRVLAVAAGCASLCLAGCAGYRAEVIPPVGMIYSNYRAPLTAEYSGQSVERKAGEASSVSILGLVAYGDCSLDTAARAGGLTTINYCDYEYLNVLGIYQKFTVMAHGK